MVSLIQLTENDKRVLIAIVIVVIVILALIGLIGSIIYRVMKWQAKKMDTLCHDVTVTRVITDKNHFIKYGRKKNWREFFKQAWIPFLILAADFIFIMIYESCVGWNYNPFSQDNGFASLFYTWELSSTEYINIWLLAFRKWVVTHEAQFIPSAWPGYIFGFVLIGGGAWYLVAVQCLVSRTFRLYTLSKSIFEKSLEGYNQNDAISKEINSASVNSQNNNQNS